MQIRILNRNQKNLRSRTAKETITLKAFILSKRANVILFSITGPERHVDAANCGRTCIIKLGLVASTECLTPLIARDIQQAGNQ